MRFHLKGHVGHVESYIGKTKESHTPYKIDPLLLSLPIDFETELILSNMVSKPIKPKWVFGPR